MNWVPWTALNSSASGKVMPKKRPGERVPEGRVAGLVHHAAKLGQHAVAEARAMQLDEQIAAAREQRAEAAGAHLGMEEQAADLATSLRGRWSGVSVWLRKVLPSSGLVWVSVLR